MEKTARKVNEQFLESEAFYSELEEEHKNTDIIIRQAVEVKGNTYQLKRVILI